MKVADRFGAVAQKEKWIYRYESTHVSASTRVNNVNFTLFTKLDGGSNTQTRRVLGKNVLHFPLTALGRANRDG